MAESDDSAFFVSDICNYLYRIYNRCFSDSLYTVISDRHPIREISDKNNLIKKLILLTLIANIWIARSQKSAALEAIPIGKNMAIGLSVNSRNRVFVSFPNRDGDGKYSLT